MISIPPVPDLIETERLLIRSPRTEDIPALHEAVRESLPELKPWMPWAHDGYNLEECERSTREAVARFVTRRDLRYHLFDRHTRELLGSAGLHRIEWSVPRFEIGYWIRSSRAGRGYVSEAVVALGRCAFEELGARRVEIRCDDRNEGSARVAERCGFTLDATLRNWRRGPDGTLRAERIYSLTDPSSLVTDRDS